MCAILQYNINKSQELHAGALAFSLQSFSMQENCLLVSSHEEAHVVCFVAVV